MIYLLLVFGLILLVAGGESLVRGASALALRLGLSPLLVGLTVVGFGTSTPELVTSLQAAFAGSPGIALGNVVGSNIANILLILGVAAVICPFAISRAAFLRDGAALALATLATVILAQFGTIGRIAGLVLVVSLAAYLYLAWRGERSSPDAPDLPETGGAGPTVSLVLVAGGIAMTVFGARFLVQGATELAQLWGISDAVIGLTVVAVGTSLPELVTSVIAAMKRQTALAFGNVVGSNIYNILGILGVTALVHPLEVAAEIAVRDVWIMAGATVALALVAASGWRATRGEGAALLVAYAAYIGWLAMAGGV